MIFISCACGFLCFVSNKLTKPQTSHLCQSIKIRAQKIAKNQKVIDMHEWHVEPSRNNNINFPTV